MLLYRRECIALFGVLAFQRLGCPLGGKLVFCENVILLVTWEDILTRFNVTSQKLQTSGLDFNTAVKLLGSLKDFVHDLRDRFDEYEKIAVEKCGHSEYEGEQRRI